MKIRDILNLLNSEYFLISSDDNEYFVQYFKKNEIPSEVLDANLAQIEPVVAIKKSVFDENAGDNDFVAALKVITTDQLKTTEETVNVEDVYEENPRQERPYENFYTQEEKDNTTQSSFPFGGFGFDPSIFSKMITPEMLQSFSQSDFMKDLMSPENINKILNSEQFKEFTQNIDIGDLMSKMYSSNQSSEPEYDDEYDEYEEYGYYDEPDDDEYEEF